MENDIGNVVHQTRIKHFNMKTLLLTLVICLVLSSCATVNSPTVTTIPESNINPTPTTLPAADATSTPPVTISGKVPNFEHIILMVLENRDYKDVIGNPQMQHLNALAKQNVLLTNYFAVSHPSLPNYIAMISGSTQNITEDCIDCSVNQTNLADLIEASGRTWKTYQEDMPSSCFVGNAPPYFQKHDPFIYFDSIRLNPTRCNNSVVPLTQLDSDLSSGQLPNFSFIMPNMCNSGHDCSSETTDNWVNDMVTKLQDSSALGKNSLIVITYDEGEHSNDSCCGMGSEAGGQAATILISPLAKSNFEDNTPYSHYGLLKTILAAWNLPDLGNTKKATTQPIEAPWAGQQSSAVAHIVGTSTPAPDPSSAMPGSTGELAFPIRAAFYYPWFPQAWDQKGQYPFTQYRPSLGYYNEDDQAVIRQHIAAMQYGKIQAGIASWWGKDHYTNDRVPELLKAGEETGFRWSVYVEGEGYSDPSIEVIRKDLEYIRDQFASSSSYFKIDGHFVVFVYADSHDGCGMVDRWKEANTVGAYLVLKVFPGYQSCANQPDAWHQYAPSRSQKQIGKDSFTISPGFWLAGKSQPRLVRDLDTWNTAIQAMIASGSNFQLITTFNEWGEGSAVESAQEWESTSGHGSYLDALHYDGVPPSALSLSNNHVATTQPGTDSGNVLVGAGDIGNCDLTGVELTAQQLESFPNAAIFTLGDNTYPDGKPIEYQNCFDFTWGKYKMRTHPSSGNHDYLTQNASGYYGYFGAAAGDPGKGYYSYDLGDWHIIVLNSNCEFVGGCNSGSPQEEWLKNDLAANPALCTLAYWHHPLFSSGEHGNNAQMIDLWQTLYASGADLVINGHDHNYERFAPQDPEGNPDPVRGIRQFVVGTGGGELRNVTSSHEPNSEMVIANTYGLIKLDLNPTSYSWRFLPVAGSTATDNGSGTCHP